MKLSRLMLPARAPGPAVAAFMEAIPIALLLLDPASLVAVAGNAEAAALFRCADSQLADSWLAVLRATPEGLALGSRLISSAQPGADPFEAMLCLLDGTRRSVLVRVRQTTLDGQELLVATLQDVTRSKRAEAAQAAAERESRRRLADLETLYRTAPLGLAQLDADLRYVRVNEALAVMNGVSADGHLGRYAWQLAPELRQETEPLLRRVLATGERTTGLKLRGQTAAAPGMTRDWVTQYYPVHDPETGLVAGVGMVCEDVTGQRRAEQAQALLLRELDHRVKNLFAVIAGLVTFTARGAQTPQEMRATLLGRIDALARAHDLVKLALGGGFAAAEGAPHHTTLKALAEALLAAFRTGPEPQRLRLEGAEIGIGALAAPPLALILHELATNAARHGALARPGGHLTVGWEPSPPEGLLRLVWDERGASSGPATPGGQGFGHRLVAQCAMQLGGRASFDWREEGLLVELALPLARLEA